MPSFWILLIVQLVILIFLGRQFIKCAKRHIHRRYSKKDYFQPFILAIMILFFASKLVLPKVLDVSSICFDQYQQIEAKVIDVNQVTHVVKTDAGNFRIDYVADFPEVGETYSIKYLTWSHFSEFSKIEANKNN